MRKLLYLSLLWVTFFTSVRAQVNDSLPQQSLFLICPADSLPAKNGYFTVVPSLGLFLMDGQVGYSIDKLRCTDFSKMFLSKRANYEKVLFGTDEIFAKCNNLLCQLTDSSLNAIAEFPDEDFDIFPGYENTVKVVSYSDDKCRCYTYDLTTNQLMPDVELDEPIIEMIPAGNGFVIATEHSLYFSHDDVCEKLATIDNEIVGLALAEFGFYFATPNSLFSYNVFTGDIYHKLNGDFMTILGDGSTVYLILKGGDVYALEHF